MVATFSALRLIDADLAVYARHGGGSFVWFGSTWTGALRPGSAMDIIADLPDHRAALAA